MFLPKVAVLPDQVKGWESLGFVLPFGLFSTRGQHYHIHV